MGKRMAMWSEKHLSAAAKEVLIKAVAQAIPTYTMSIFHLSASFCEELARGVRGYWWAMQHGYGYAYRYRKDTDTRIRQFPKQPDTRIRFTIF